MHFQNIFTSALALGATALAIPIAKDAPAVTPVVNITPRAKMPHHEKVIKISCLPFCVGKDAIDEICSKVCHGENDRVSLSFLFEFSCHNIQVLTCHIVGETQQHAEPNNS